MRRYYIDDCVNEQAFAERLSELHDRVDGSDLPALIRIRAQLYKLKEKYEESGRRFLECEYEIEALNEIISECRE